MQLENTPFTTPTIDCVGIRVPPIEWPEELGNSGIMQLAKFILESLTLGICCLSELLRNSYDNEMLPLVLSDILLLIQTLVKSTSLFFILLNIYSDPFQAITQHCNWP